MGWYNLLACSVITFFTVAAGFYEMLLAVPLPGIRSVIGQNAINTMLWHGIGGVALLMAIVAMTIWRGYQRFLWRKDFGRQVTWLYLACGTLILLIMGLHGSLGPGWPVSSVFTSPRISFWRQAQISRRHCQDIHTNPPERIFPPLLIIVAIATIVDLS